GEVADELRAEPGGAVASRGTGERSGAARVVRCPVGGGRPAGRGDAAAGKLRDEAPVGEADGAGVRGGRAGGAGDDVDGVREQPAAGDSECSDDAGRELPADDRGDGAERGAGASGVHGARDLGLRREAAQTRAAAQEPAGSGGLLPPGHLLRGVAEERSRTKTIDMRLRL